MRTAITPPKQLHKLHPQVRVPGAMDLAILLAQSLIHLILLDPRPDAGCPLNRAGGTPRLHVDHVTMAAKGRSGRQAPLGHTVDGEA